MRWYDLVLIIVVVGLIAIGLLMLTGCQTVGRWMAPIRQEELSLVSQKMLAEKDKIIQEKEVEIVKIRASKPTPLWPIYVISAIGLVGGAAIGYFLGKILIGVLLAAGGAMAIGWLQFLERYVWAFWIPFGLAVLMGLYFAYDWVKGLLAQRTVKAAKPALEKLGDGPQRKTLTSLIEKEAGSAAEKVKASLGLK